MKSKILYFFEIFIVNVLATKWPKFIYTLLTWFQYKYNITAKKNAGSDLTLDDLANEDLDKILESKEVSFLTNSLIKFTLYLLIPFN